MRTWVYMEWKHFTEESPNDGQEIIVTDGKNVTCAIYHIWVNGCFWDVSRDFGKVIYWMPLPKKPQKLTEFD